MGAMTMVPDTTPDAGPMSYDEITQLYNRLSGKLWALHDARWGANDARDALQDAFEALLRSNQRPRTPQAWILAVARHKLSNQNQRAWREMLLDQTTLADIDPHTAASPDVDVIEQENRDELADELLSLGIPDAKLLLSYANGFSCEEIADSMDADEFDVHQRVGAARRAFHKARLRAETDRLAKAAPMEWDAGMASSSRVVAVLDRLPQRQAAVLDLAVEGLRPRQIAQVLGIESNTVRVNLHYAKKKIADELGIPIGDVVKQITQIATTAATLAATA